MGDEYLEVKRLGKYRSYRLIVERDPELSTLAVGVLAKRVPLLGEWWHVPAGPAGEDAGEVIRVTRALAQFAKSQRAFLLKIEPRLPLDEAPLMISAGFRSTTRIVPNPSTVLVHLDEAESEEALLAAIGKKARHSINRARRDGISVERVPATASNCAALYSLLQETAEGRFVLRSEAYYREFWQRFERGGVGQLFFAQKDGVLLAGAFAMALGEKTTYKDGASVRDKSAYGASHALQWEVLRWAHERGARVHDLCGAPPAAESDNRSHPLFGVGQFKRSFQPNVTDYAGAFDVPLKPRSYALWVRIGDRLARRWSLIIRKDPYY